MTGRFGFLLITLFSAFLLSACTTDPDEKAIRTLIEAMRVSAERKEFARTLEPVTGDYRDNLNGGKADVERRMTSVFAPFDRLIIRAPIQKIERTGPAAVVSVKTFVMGVTGNQREIVFGSPIAPKKIDVYLEKREGRWSVTGCLIAR